ncbi:MAG TPA: LuxR C-terminal-related transcriptional regulator [Jiangellaceae bacterium]|jgi:DNA-binding CsgD family transcriptional regulator|nr:LuxR C-terminal-related transcriptional regulator [Jiangellaceae bacterium]
MVRGGTAARRERDLVRRCYAGIEGSAFQAEIVRSIHALLPVDAVFFATADPVTLLFTGAVAEDPLAMATAQFLDNEFGHYDVNKFQSLATGARRVATLDAATGGQRADSARYREIMSPLGLGDELRAALVTPAGCWGYLCLHRADSPYGFSPAEVRLIGRLAPHLGNGCRHSLTAPHRDGTTAAAPGVVVLHPDLTVAAITGEAEQWLARIADHQPDPGRLPMAVYAVAARLQSIDSETAQPGAAPTVRARSTTGDWLLIHASHLSGSLGGDIAVIIEPAHPSSLAPLLFSSLGLTPREHDVALLVLRGASTHAIGAELHLSAYTVKDHLKSIFDKIGVRSRRELVAHVLTGQQDAPIPHTARRVSD